MRILLAVDGAGHSEAACDAIGRQHFPSGSDVLVVSVVEPPYMGASFVEAGASLDLYEMLEKNARSRAADALAKTAAALHATEGSNSLHVTTKILAGSPKGAILDEAEAFGAELIIVGSHQHGKVEGFLLGSVAHAVALHAKCSVEIVRSPNAELKKRMQP